MTMTCDCHFDPALMELVCEQFEDGKGQHYMIIGARNKTRPADAPGVITAFQLWLPPMEIATLLDKLIDRVGLPDGYEEADKRESVCLP